VNFIIGRKELRKIQKTGSLHYPMEMPEIVK
jgi:hypothetical protein